MYRPLEVTIPDNTFLVFWGHATQKGDHNFSSLPYYEYQWILADKSITWTQFQVINSRKEHWFARSNSGIYSTLLNAEYSEILDKQLSCEFCFISCLHPLHIGSLPVHLKLKTNIFHQMIIVLFWLAGATKHILQTSCWCEDSLKTRPISVGIELIRGLRLDFSWMVCVDQS